ncbi:hypothetical protein [Escherichia coli ISC41]|nr:hypothetical protein [Escherichia coli ISC41]
MVDTILLQQVFRSLLLKRQPGIEECQTRAFYRARLPLPTSASRDPAWC